MKANLKNSKEGVRTWSRWIGGAALVLALASPLVPSTSSAVIDIGEEVIEIEGEAPWSLPNWGGHTGGGAPNGTPSGDMGGGGGGGGGGGVIVPSGGGSSPKPSPAEKRLANAKNSCLKSIEGVWEEAAFEDIDTNVILIGYSCKYKPPVSNGYKYMWLYYDSEGFLNKHCKGDDEVSECDGL